MVITQEEFKDEILKQYAEHGNGGLIAKKLDITTYRVYKCLRANGIEPKKIGGKAKCSVAQMEQLYKSGLSTTEVAQKLNMTPGAIVERLQNHGIKLRTKSEASALRGHTKITKNDEQDVIDMYKSGMSYRQIAEKYNVYMDAVGRVLRKHGLNPRNNFGANNHAWKGGRVPLNKLIRNHTKYTDFVKHIMYSRNYTCEMTGQRGGVLNVHHIKPFSQLVDDFIKINGHIINREELNKAIEDFTPFWDESNVLLITEAKHKEIHSSVI